MYASLLVKTNRISRIFNCARKSAKRPSFISPKSQMLITGILVAIQVNIYSATSFNNSNNPSSRGRTELIIEMIEFSDPSQNY